MYKTCSAWKCLHIIDSQAYLIGMSLDALQITIVGSWCYHFSINQAKTDANDVEASIFLPSKVNREFIRQNFEFSAGKKNS